MNKSNGIYESRLRVPKGMGFLPAFWLMTTSEEEYGQWPRCGEIDTMEILTHVTTPRILSMPSWKWTM